MKHYNLPLFSMLFMMFFPVIYASAQSPSIGGFNVYYGHLHNHTSLSDGEGTPEQAYEYAKNTAHLDFFGLSDHSEMFESGEYTMIKNAANALNNEGEFAAFYGFEWSSVFQGHVTIINTEDYCEYTSSATSNFTGLLSWVNAHNGLAFFNHPGWAWWALQEFNHFTDIPSEKFVGMELWNDLDGFGTYFYNDGFFSSDGNKGYFDEALIRGWKIGASGSDDNHYDTWGTRTQWRMGVLAEGLSRELITDALIARRFFSTLDKNLSLSFKINGAQMGSSVTGGNLAIEILARDADVNEAFTKVVLIKNGVAGEPIYLNPWLNEINITLPMTGADNDYFYVKVTQTDGDEAISSPVFIEGMSNLAPVVEITNPLNNDEFYTGEQVNITAVASDADGTLEKVEFYAGAIKIGEDLTSPYEYIWSPELAGNYQLTAVATDNRGSFTVSEVVTLLVSDPVQNGIVESRIKSGNDDAEQYQKGTVVLNSTTLNLVYESKTTGNQIVGLLFRELGIPQGASITNAYMEFKVDKRTTNTCSLVLKGEAADNAVDFAALTNNLSNRATTSASVGWIPAPWKVVGSLQQTPDIKQVVQEIVNRPGWTTTSKLVILISGSGTRNAESFEGMPSGAPVIHIEYTLSKSGIIAEKSQINSEESTILEKKILIYPNPVYDMLNVKLNGIRKVENMLVYSVTGTLVREIKINHSYGEMRINCGNLTPGTYLLKLNSAEGSFTTRFIKQ